MLAFAALAAVLAVGIALDNGVGFVRVCGLAALTPAQTNEVPRLQRYMKQEETKSLDQ